MLGIAVIATGFGLPLTRSDGPSATSGGSRAVRPLAISDHECNHFGAIACPSSSSSGALSTADCRLNDGSSIDFLQFTGTAGETVTVEMSSAFFDTYLFLLDPSPAVVAQNDDVAPGNTDSRIVFTLASSGTWTVGATSFAPNQIGAYSLTLQCSSAPPAGTPIPTVTPTPHAPTPTVTPVPGPCLPDATTLCVNGGRFRVQIDWAAPDGRSGPGVAVTETSDTGMFWFSSANNIEAIVKVVNGCSFNSRYWVFAGGLTDVATSLRVTDTQRGVIRTYANPRGVPFQPIQDTAAFATCP